MLSPISHHSRAALAVVLLVVIAVAAAALFAIPKLSGGGHKAAPDKLADTKLAPEPWAADPRYDPANAGAQSAAAKPQPKPAPAPIDPKTGMPAASAGTNGSFTPPSPAERKRVYTATHPVGGNDSALLLNRTALAPPSPAVLRARSRSAAQIHVTFLRLPD